MPKPNRGGRRVAYTQMPKPTQPNNNQQPAQPAQPTPAPAQVGGGIGFRVKNVLPAGQYTTINDNDAQAMRLAVDSSYTPSVKDAIKQYIANNSNTKNGFSKSQNLNYALENGIKLNANEKYMDKYLTQGMHDTGQNITTYRGAHSDLIDQLMPKGVNYQNLTNAQLNQMLTGASWVSKSYTSSSYDINKNPFLSGSQSGGREVVMEIRTDAGVKMVYGAKAQAEIIQNKGTSYEIKQAYFTGQTVYPRTKSGGYKQIKLIVEAK